MQCVILDKSYLQGATASQVQALCRDNVVLMIETLFYELLTAKDPQWAQCFRKLPGENPVELLESPGPLLRYEIENAKPAYPLTEHVLPIRFSLNPDPRLDEEQTRLLADRASGVTASVAGYPDLARGVGNWFPDLLSMSDEERSAECSKLKTEMSPRDVRAVYRDIAAEVFEEFPSEDLLDPTWALYRWTQAEIIAGLDFLARHGFSSSTFNPKRLENHLHGVAYLTVAPLAGALATRDKELASNFRLICKTGKVIS